MLNIIKSRLLNFPVLLLVSGCILLFLISGIVPVDRKLKFINNQITAPAFPGYKIQSGDIIFRDGRGFISSLFKRLSLKDPAYSHAGIIHRENGGVFVYHIIGGEGRNNKIKKDLLLDFCSPLQSHAFAMYRTDQSGMNIDSLAGNYFSKGILFDNNFSLVSDDKMYCTEFIFKILQQVSGQNNYLPLTVLSGIKYISCDNIYLSPHLIKIYSYNYSN